tara:strand:- start:518 stop:1165 length:648 start_codon:yes stop_codon:yes gene_type:complete
MFNILKTTHLAAYLIDKSDGKLNILKLVKLLYICDREFMKQYAKPITYDRFVSMPHGPVLSSTYDLMSGSGHPDNQIIWNNIISDREDHSISLNNIGFKSVLLDIEKKVADFVHDTFKSFSQWELVEYTHDNFDEWIDPNGSSNPIKYYDVFLALGYTGQDATLFAQKLEMDTTQFSYDLTQMKEAVEAESFKLPNNLKGQSLREFILEQSKAIH